MHTNHTSHTDQHAAAEFDLQWRDQKGPVEACSTLLGRIEKIKTILLRAIAREDGTGPKDEAATLNWDLADWHVVLVHQGSSGPAHLTLFTPGLQVWREVVDGRVKVRQDPLGRLAGIHQAIAHLAHLGRLANTWRSDLRHPENLAQTPEAPAPIVQAFEALTGGLWSAWYQAAHQAVAQAARQAAALPQETPSIRPTPRADVAAVGPRIRQVMAARA